MALPARLDAEDAPKPEDIASTPNGVKAFAIVMGGDKSYSDYQRLEALDKGDKAAREEVGWAIESFIVSGGDTVGDVEPPKGDSMSLALDLLRIDLARMDARGQGVACGKGWISPRAKCGKDKASQTPKENLAKTTEKRKKLHALKAEVEGKPSSARKGGKLTLREKDEQQREAPKKKISPIDAVNEKYASANPSDADVAGWQKDMAVASTIPDPEKAERKIANDLMGGRLGASTKGRKAIAEAIYQDREDARKGREYKASDFSFWGFQRDLDKAKAKVASSRATPEGRQKAQKLVDKLEATKASELKSAQETADRLNQRDSGTKAERLAKINQELDEWVSEDVAKQKSIHEKVKSGDKRAIADAAHEVARKLKTYRAPRDSRKASLAQADQEAIRDHLMDVHQKSGGDANVLGLKKGFTMRELRKAYRESAATAHPDKGGTEEQFRGVSEAYERLKSQARLDSLSARLDAIARAKTINGVNYTLNKNSRWERVKSGVAHGAVHLGENMAAWKVGKVVGGAIGQVAASHGADPEVARLLSETAVQALTSTALYARGGKRSGTDIATHMIAQSAAAFSGKISHTGVDDLSEMLGGSERVQAISALVAGKMAGIGTVMAAHKSGVARKLAEGLPAAKTRIGSLVGLGGGIRRDAVSRKPLNLAEVDNAAELVMMGYAIATLDKYRGDSMGLALDLLRIDLARMDRGQGKPCGKGYISARKKCSEKGKAQLTADLKAGDEGAKKRVQRGKELAKGRQELSRQVQADKGKKARDVVSQETKKRESKKEAPGKNPAIPTKDPYKKELSTFNQIGSERSYAGVDQFTGNSRIFGARDIIKHGSDKDVQDFFQDKYPEHLKGLKNDGGPFEQRAYFELGKLWERATPESRQFAANEWRNAKSPVLRSLSEKDLKDYDAAQTQKAKDEEAAYFAKKAAKEAARKKKASTPKEPDDLDSLFDSHADAFPSYKARVRTPAGTLGITHQPGDKRFGSPMMASYGHLLGSYGKAEDRKAWDFYLGDEPGNEDLYEVLQTTEAGMPDERKFISHCRDMDHAREVFVSHAGQNRFGYIQPKGWDFFE